MIKTKMDRRALLGGMGAVGFSAAAPALAKPVLPQTRFKVIEASAGGRLGVAILDLAFGATIGTRLNERFALCSTFKLPLAAAVLEAADKGQLSLDEIIPYTKADLVFHAPVTGPNLAKGALTIRALAEAAQLTSDNVAANLLIKRLGGPQAVTAIWRRWGDPATRIDRYEPEMNLVKAGDVQDTTTPEAIAMMVAKLCTEDVLKPASREMLIDWMIRTQTGLKRLRAGFPKQWRAGDKTGTMNGVKGVGNKVNDVAIVWPPRRAPVIVAAFYESPYDGEDTRDQDQAILAQVGRIAADWIA
ncbi:MAG TPA: class A beta-lactamase [Alphaproteobacteria bacterium]|nr:class A beta-lactamase [Alphaproteobacteria bacterium]HAJ45191.1 class A beta-lactamase [Alphaproteobacteria bacterium]